MSGIYTSIAQLIGGTPLLELTNLERKEQLQSRLLAKLEFMNPAGSVKDRVALSMILDAEKKGLLKPGSVIIEPTSGNTGIGLAAVAASRGYRTVIVMPDSMSMERRQLMTAYGAELVLTDGKKGMQGAVDKANALLQETPNSFLAGQFDNPANPAAHEATTGPEIWADTDGKVDIFVAGVGTGGTITGTGRYLKKKNPEMKIIAVEPAGSPLLSKGLPGPHGLQGIGANFIPSVLDTGIYDEIVTATEAQAYEAGRALSKCEGILAGISSGAALHAAIQIAKQSENAGKTVVVLLPDTGDRYLSTPLFAAP
jgi:cysteine synthase A